MKNETTAKQLKERLFYIARSDYDEHSPDEMVDKAINQFVNEVIENIKSEIQLLSIKKLEMESDEYDQGLEEMKKNVIKILEDNY